MRSEIARVFPQARFEDGCVLWGGRKVPLEGDVIAVLAELARELFPPQPPVLIFAHARSGSATLQAVLEVQGPWKLATEPFHPRRRVPLETLWPHHAGLKHLCTHLSRADNLALLEGDFRRIFLRRENLLAAVVSAELSRQTGYWGSDPSRQLGGPLQPLDVAAVARRVEALHADLGAYAGALVGLPHLALRSEDLFTGALDEVIDFLELRPLRSPFREMVGILLSDRMKVNSPESLRRLPNLAELERELGGRYGTLG